MLKQKKELYIKPEDVGGYPQYFMCHWRCPGCSCCNDETFMIDKADYWCSACRKTFQYRLPPSKRKPERKKLVYSFILTWNGR